MSRIDDDVTTQAYNEQAYNDKKANDKKANEKKRDEECNFDKLVQKKVQDQSKQTSQANLSRYLGKSAASQALMARRGIQSNKFQETLQEQADEALSHTEGTGKERSTDLKKVDSDKVEDRRKTDKQDGDKLAERYDRVSGDDPRKQGGGGGMSGEGDADSDKDKKGFSAGQATASVAGAGAAFAPQDVQGHAMPQIPAEVLQQLVARVMVGVNTEGLNEFHIQFRENVLAGSSLKITAKDGKITAQFTTQDVNVKRLLKASEGQLSRAFHQKGLYLDRLEVIGP